MNDLEQAIEEFRQAVEELAKRNRVKQIIQLILGLHPGIPRPNWETDPMVDLEAFVDAVEEATGPESTPPPAPAPEPEPEPEPE